MQEDEQYTKAINVKITATMHKEARRIVYLDQYKSLGDYLRRLIAEDLKKHADKLTGLDKYLTQSPGVAGKKQEIIGGPDIKDILG